MVRRLSNRTHRGHARSSDLPECGAHALEALEPRVLLSWGWEAGPDPLPSPGHVAAAALAAPERPTLLLSHAPEHHEDHAAAAAFTVAPLPAPVAGGNRSLTFLFHSTLDAGEGGGGGEGGGYAIIEGVRVEQADIPGVGADAAILGVNDAGTIIGRLADREVSPARLTLPFIVQDGVRTLLPDLVTEVVGPEAPVWERMHPVRIAEDGSVILTQGPEPGGLPPRAWLLQGTVLTFLWAGTAIDLNDHGDVLGRRDTGDASEHVVRSAGGDVAVITGLLFPGRLNNAREVFGSLTQGRLAVWRDGEVSVLAQQPPLPLGHTGLLWTILDADDAGQVLARGEYAVGRTAHREDFLFVPGAGLRRLGEVTFGRSAAPETRTPGETLRLGSHGRILASEAILSPVEERLAWSLAEGSPLAAADGAVLGVNAFGDPILLTQTHGRWSGRLVNLLLHQEDADGQALVSEVELIREPRTGTLFLFLIAGGRAYSTADHPWELSLTASPLHAGEGSQAITANLEAFLTSDQRLVVAGAAAGGDLVIYFQHRPLDLSVGYFWIFNNLRQMHLVPRGQELAPISSNLTAFSTPWGTDHIAYLDPHGQVHAVWWAPDSPLWRTNQLTTLESTGRLHGHITSQVTPWRTLHINALDAQGLTTAVWWAPGFGGTWAVSPLAGEDAPRFAPESMSAFITPWNAMTIAGRDADSGEIVVYWWAPATGIWQVERLVPVDAPKNQVFTGQVAALARPDGAQEIFARRQDGAAVRLLWTLDGDDDWRSENITDLAL